ncbi:hypothetical protein GOP47_0009491 [Adiantum capillus-veneris]|uniref:Sec-independent protein translocase protein TATA, chloroplastic n=1 Tax=Adiantum capillus-veneris TaxID=13818 RepID=A0A9D4ZJQ1_ADICA|nr:hypothetical protein GOP47_0009491 [Adiantum capillus-veneris]
MMALATPTPSAFSVLSNPSPSRAGLACSSFLPSGLHTSGSSAFARDGFRSLALQYRTRSSNHSKRGAVNVNALFGLGVPELVVIAGVAALIFGPKKLPEIGKSLGKTVKSFQQAAKEFESEVKQGGDSASADTSKPEVLSTSTVVEKEKENTEV